MAPRPTKKSPGSTTPHPPPRPDLPVQARHPPPPGLPATAPRPTAVVGRVAELMGGKRRRQAVLVVDDVDLRVVEVRGEEEAPFPALGQSQALVDGAVLRGEGGDGIVQVGGRRPSGGDGGPPSEKKGG